jgi:hypothetical protein
VAEEERPIKTLGDYHEDVIRFDLDGFVEHHGGAFLVHHGSRDELKPLPGKAKTAIFDPVDPGDLAPLNAGVDQLVFPLHPMMPGAPGAETISIGRSEANDVVIPDESVSAIHAFVQVGEGGEMGIEDLNSTNGSFVNGSRVPPQGAQAPTPLRAGDHVQLGSAEFTFLPAEDFRGLVSRLLG